jgi:phenylpropionate dioxygenase-like ring-hydroxylating dioxygenase large terminal subunit
MIESILWDDWHVVAELAELQRRVVWRTRLLGVALTIQWDPDSGLIRACRELRDDRADVPDRTCTPDRASTPGRADLSYRAGVPGRADVPIEALEVRYGFVWICLGVPTRPIVDFAEYHEPDRLSGTAGSVRVAVSGLRAVENFLDLSHLAFVHAGFLGEEPHTEIAAYAVDTLADGTLLATGCRVYQPKPSPVESSGFDVDYIYAVLRPYLVVLYKANPVEPSRKDMIALFVQPLTEESCVAHILTCYLPHEIHPPTVRRFQQFIFGQDRPILENQIPKRLPLDPRAEASVRADLSSASYRRWLAAAGVRFGALAPPA